MIIGESLVNAVEALNFQRRYTDPSWFKPGNNLEVKLDMDLPCPLEIFVILYADMDRYTGEFLNECYILNDPE